MFWHSKPWIKQRWPELARLQVINSADWKHCNAENVLNMNFYYKKLFQYRNSPICIRQSVLQPCFLWSITVSKSTRYIFIYICCCLYCWTCAKKLHYKAIETLTEKRVQLISLNKFFVVGFFFFFLKKASHNSEKSVKDLRPFCTINIIAYRSLYFKTIGFKQTHTLVHPL